MERRAKVGLFKEIRREYDFGVGSVRGVARVGWMFSFALAAYKPGQDAQSPARAGVNQRVSSRW